MLRLTKAKVVSIAKVSEQYNRPMRFVMRMLQLNCLKITKRRYNS
jgi:hypothetical protein